MNTALKFAVLLGVSLSSTIALAQSGRGADYGDGDRRSDISKSRSSERGGARDRYDHVEREAPSASRHDLPRGGNGRADADPRRLERIAGFDGGHRGGYEAPRSGYREGYQDGRAHQRIDDRREHLRQGEVRYQGGHRDRHDWRDDRRDHRRDDRYDHRRDRHSDWRHPQWRSHWHHGWGGHRYRAPVRYVYPRGYGRLEWRIGFTLPRVFLLDRYYVDHHYYRVAPPPYGCRWLRVDGDLLLVELATGYVVEALYDFFYW
jgi:Ni/Co efflux regulator RcnB